MKTLITKFFAVGGMAIIMLASCKKDEIKVVAPATATNAAITLSTTTPTLSKATLASTAITITAAQANYGYDAAVSYTVQLAVKGTSFAKPVEVTLTKDALSKVYTVQDFNNLLLSMNLTTGVSAQVEVRLKTSLSTTAGITYSAVSTITATPFALTSYIYVPGAYQGWNPATADSLQSATGNGVYTGIINFTAGNLEFKITPAKKWDIAYGTTTAGKIGTSGGNITVPAAGLYYFTADLNNGTLTLAAADYMSAIGNAPVGSGWSTDIDLKYNNGTLAWEGVVPMVVGEFKYRMNHAWDNSYGIPKTGADGTFLNNTDNNNIPIAAAGNYKVGITTVYSDYSTDIAKLGKINKTLTAKYTVVKQ